MSEVITLADGSVLEVSLYPLPEGLEDGVMNRAQLAVAFRVSENTVTKWVQRGMPVQTDGQNGVAYEFRLSHCYAWRMSIDAAARDAKARGDQLATQAAMLFLNLDGEEADSRGSLTADEVKKWAEAEYQRNRVDEQRRDLVRAGPMRELCEELLNTVARSLKTFPDYCEREFGLSPAEVAKVELHGDETLLKMRQLIEEALHRPAQVIEFGQARQQSDMGL